MNSDVRFSGLMVGVVLSACDPSHVAHVDVEVAGAVQQELEAQLPMVLYSTAVRVSSPKAPDDGVGSRDGSHRCCPSSNPFSALRLTESCW